jgi:hypothetical protein
MGKAKMKWTKEIDEFLAFTAKDNWTFTETADAISKKFGVIATRNSVAGRASRIGIAFSGQAGRKPKPVKTPKTKKQKEQAKPVAIKPKMDASLVHPDTFSIIPLTENQRKEAKTKFLNPNARALRFMELLSKHCRYPVGDTRNDTLRFCGADVAPGRSTPYCEYCYPLVYTPHTPASKRMMKCPK